MSDHPRPASFGPDDIGAECAVRHCMSLPMPKSRYCAGHSWIPEWPNAPDPAPSVEASLSCSPLVAWIDAPERVYADPGEAGAMPYLVFVGSGKRIEIAFDEREPSQRGLKMLDQALAQLRRYIADLTESDEADAPAAFDSLTEAVTRERKRLEAERGKAPTPRELGAAVVEGEG